MHSTNHGSFNQERGNTVENATLLNGNMEYEWEINRSMSKKGTHNAQSRDIILALIVSFVIIIGLAVTYIFLVDYLWLDILNPKQHYTDTDDAPFRFINTKVTPKDIWRLRNDLRIAFDASSLSSKSLLVTTVALVFNDCSGPKSYANGTVDHAITICDGCIDTDPSNHPGLEEYAIEPLEQIYYEGDYDQIMSRSDFWAMAGTVAIQSAAQLKYGNELEILEQFADQMGMKPSSAEDTEHELRMLPSLPLYFGRIDCHSTPFAKEQTQYPSVNDGFSIVYQWFVTHFGFNMTEMVALLGAHTLRTRAHGKSVFDNEYYVLLMDKTQMWHRPTRNGTQYVNKDGTASMLNSDIHLVFDIDQSDTQSLCYEIVQKYAQNNQQFYNDFAGVWDKMVTLGYTKNMLTRFS